MLFRAKLNLYKNKTYVSVLLVCALSYCLIGSLLLPTLNYMVLSLDKHDKQFINYATLVNIVPSLPFLLSFAIAGLTNQFSSHNLYKIVGLVLCLSSIIILLTSNNLLLFSLYVLIMSLLFRVIYFSLDKQITYILHQNVTNFQSDLLILSTLGGIAFTKLGVVVYQSYGHIMNVAIFVVLSLGLIYAMKFIPQTSVIKASPLISKYIVKDIFSSKVFIRLMVKLGLISVVQSPFYLLIFIRFHEINLSITNYANLLIIGAICSIVAGVLCKFNRWLSITNVIRLGLFCNGILLLLLSWFSQVEYVFTIYIIVVFISSVINIQNFALIIGEIRADDKLSQYTSFINGVIASWLYIVYIAVELCINLLLKFNINLLLLFGATGCMLLLLSLIISRQENQQRRH